MVWSITKVLAAASSCRLDLVGGHTSSAACSEAASGALCCACGGKQRRSARGFLPGNPPSQPVLLSDPTRRVFPHAKPLAPACHLHAIVRGRRRCRRAPHLSAPLRAADECARPSIQGVAVPRSCTSPFERRSAKMERREVAATGSSGPQGRSLAPLPLPCFRLRAADACTCICGS